MRDALRPWLARQHDAGLSSTELETRGVEDYKRAFGHAITARYWRELFTRTIRRDGGFQEWNRLEIYLADRLTAKPAPAGMVKQALNDLAAESQPEAFADLENYIAACVNPHDPSEPERVGLWALALRKFAELVQAGASEKSSGRRLRNFLFARAKFLAPTRNALRMAFERKLEQWQRDNPHCLDDGRAANGERPEYPSKDVRRVRHSAAIKNGGRIDAAWREEYSQLSEYTRQRHPRARRCPDAFYRVVNRERVDALAARVQGRRTLRRMIGGVKRQASGIPTMARWTVDDWTSNIVVLYVNQNGTFSLIQPQIITVMDFASRKWVGWSMANMKAPSAELVCTAVLDGFRRHGVPKKLCVENGYVFGKSLNVNGKVDDQGRTIVAGLSKYGCTVHHFDKMSPTSKGELEKSFDLFQRGMERYPGYGGRQQMRDASEDFKREQMLIQRMINAENWDLATAKESRMTYDEFVEEMRLLIEKYNATPQHGHLDGLSPNEAFDSLADKSDPPIKFDNQLEWLLANEHYRVRVVAGGVEKVSGGPLRHYGRPIQVRGGDLPNRIGQELWALVDRLDDSIITFMTLDFRSTFTVETCRNPSADEHRIVSGTSVLAAEKRKIGQHERAVDDEFKALKTEFGNPRRDLLAQIRGESKALPGVADETTRRVILNSRIEASAEQMQAQRQAITEKRQQNTQNKARARRQGIPAALVDDDAQSRRALELLGDLTPPAPARVESMEESE